MIVKKERKIPLKILKLEALLRRLPAHHRIRNKIEEELKKGRAGYRGEQAIDYYLKTQPIDDGLILHDNRLKQGKDHFFQIDTLILTTRFFMILEIKNIAGTLYFDQEFQQLIRKKNGEEEKFQDPIIQVKRQQQHFQSWLEKHKFPTPPIIPLVVITNPSAVIRTSPAYQEAREKILHAEMVPSKLNHYHQIFQNEAMTLKQLNQLSRTVIKKHVPSNPDMLKQFALSVDDIQTGVHCLECHCLPMQRIRGYWDLLSLPLEGQTCTFSHS